MTSSSKNYCNRFENTNCTVHGSLFITGHVFNLVQFVDILLLHKRQYYKRTPFMYTKN